MQGYRDPFNRGTYPWGNEDQALVQWYKDIIRVRNITDCLRTGALKIGYCYNDVISYSRYIKDGKDVFGNPKADGFALIALNRSTDSAHWVEIDIYEAGTEYLYDSLDESFKVPVIDFKARLHIQPLQCRILLNKQTSDKI